MGPPASDVFVRVTAGPTYDPSTHEVVLVNSSKPTRISSPICTLDLSVRIQNFRGLPKGSPSTSPYFSHPNHKSDKYSISFALVPHRSIPGQSLVFGNDIDHPVRDRLPYGTGTAFKILKSVIDPGLDGDLYADKPHLYGCALSSLNVLWVGGKPENGILQKVDNRGDDVVEEGGEGEGIEWRKEREVPEQAGKRKSWFLGKGRPTTWVWEAGREYRADFFNPYLDFNDFALKLPGFSLSVLGYLGGEDYLRYVLKDSENGDVLFVVVFSLIRKEDVDREEVELASKAQSPEARDPSNSLEPDKDFQPAADDVD